MRLLDGKSGYNDVKLFVILIPLINVLNYYLTYPGAQLNWFLVLTFTVDTLEGYAAWWAIRSIIIYLDKRIPYHEQPVRRILVQVASTTLAGTAVIALLTEGINRLATDEPLPDDFYPKTMFLFVIWIFVVNGIYVGLHFYQQWQDAEQKRLEQQKLEQKGLKVTSGKNTILLKFEDIIGLYVDGDYAVVCNNANKKFFVSRSLDQLEEEVPARFFFRLNRQYLIHRSIINGFARGENGKLQVAIQPCDNLPATISVSRLRAPAFREWFQQTTPVTQPVG